MGLMNHMTVLFLTFEEPSMFPITTVPLCDQYFNRILCPLNIQTSAVEMSRAKVLHKGNRERR